MRPNIDDMKDRVKFSQEWGSNGSEEKLFNVQTNESVL